VDAETSGGQIGSLVTRGDVAVAGGGFTVEIDFAATAFAGEARWLDIGVLLWPKTQYERSAVGESV
jgi:hypothetical protein